MLLECQWFSTKNVLKSFPENKNIFKSYEQLCRVKMLYNLPDSIIFDLCLTCKRAKFKPKETIIQPNVPNKDFYFITKGRVKMKNSENAKTIRVYDTGNCFGELSLLGNASNPFSIIAKENTTCFLLSSQKFFELLQEQRANDYMKEKMLLEDNDIVLSDLYYLSYLGRGRFGNVCLVHNKMSFFAAKAISKLAAEKQKTGVKNLINEKKTMMAVDHPFIVKLVKTLKKDNWCFFLEEFIVGKNFNEYLDTKQDKLNIEELRFYAACFFCIVHYLNKNSIVHRDIKPSNIMIDSNGYLKLIDFGTARKLKNYSQSIIGTPNFIAPEILLAKGYSFPCDYWSIGICLYYIYFGYLPFGNKALELLDIYNEIIEKSVEFPKGTPKEVTSLITGLLKKKPSQRIKDFNTVQNEPLFKDYPWESLLQFKVKPFWVPDKDPRDNPANLDITTSPFEVFMEHEKFETIQMQTLRINNTKETNKNASNVNAQWFNDF